MITGVAAVLLGESVLAGTASLLIYVLIMVVINHAYFLLSEEPGLAKRFGSEYRRYEQAVPRWIPRRTPYAAAGCAMPTDGERR